jgi:hypothetical protein
LSKHSDEFRSIYLIGSAVFPGGEVFMHLQFMAPPWKAALPFCTIDTSKGLHVNLLPII